MTLVAEHKASHEMSCSAPKPAARGPADSRRMSLSLEAGPVARQAAEAATAAAAKAGVLVVDEHDRDQLRDVEGLLIAIWGMSPHGAPIPFDLLRSISHAGCNVSAAYYREDNFAGQLSGLCHLAGARLNSGLIAGVLPGTGDKGVGFALKQHQRAWSLARGIESMTWTFSLTGQQERPLQPDQARRSGVRICPKIPWRDAGRDQRQ